MLKQQILRTYVSINFDFHRIARLGALRASSFVLLALFFTGGINNSAFAQPYEQVAVGESHVCGLDASGIVDCTATAIAQRLVEPDDLPALREITAGQQHSCGITLDGDVVCWGTNALGVLDVPQLNGPVETIAAGRNHTCAIDANGLVTCWGLNSNLQLDAPTSTFLTLGANLSSSCGILSDGDLVCWTTDSKFFTPEPVTGPFTDLDLARNVGCALTANGDIECWATTFGDSPTPPTNGPYTDLTVTDSSICGLQFDGLLDCSFSAFRDEDQLLSDEFPTDVQYSSIERSAERFTPTPICGVRADNGAIECFGGANSFPAPPGVESVNNSLDARDVTLGLTAEFYSTSAVELFWNRLPFVFPPLLVEVFRDDEFLTTTNGSFSFLDRDSIQSGESLYRVRTVDSVGNRGEFSNPIVVDRSTGVVRLGEGDAESFVNPRPDSFVQLEQLLINVPSSRTSFQESSAILSWETAKPMGISFAGYEIKINDETVAFVNSETSIFLNRDFLANCRVYSVAAISNDGEILDFRSVVLNAAFNARDCPSTN